MECEEVRPHLSAYVDGFLDPRIKGPVEEHVSTCKACRQSLESLQGLVQELNDLKQVKAPHDFLEQVHARMKQGPDIHALMKKLFLPLHVKIPYQFAAAAAMTVLIFFIIHTPQMKKEMEDFKALDEVHELGDFADSPEQPRLSRKKEAPAPAPDVSKARQPGDPDSDNRSGGSARAVKTEVTSPGIKGRPGLEHLSETTSFREDEKIKAKAERSAAASPEVVELYLTLGAKISSDNAILRSDYGRGLITAPEKDSPISFSRSVDRTVSRPASRSMEPGRREKYQMKTDSSETAAKPLEKSFTGEGAYSELKHLIVALNGKVQSTEYDPDTGQAKILDAEIPSDRYGLFCDKLHELGTPQSPWPEIETRATKLIRIRIYLIQS